MTAPVMPSRVVPLRRRPRPVVMSRLALVDGNSAPVLVLRPRERDEQEGES